MGVIQLNTPLGIDEIEFRIQSINNGKYATILAYKDARVDMKRLDDVFGPLFWKREHTNNNANCIVSVFNKDIEEWVSKEDTGSESIAEAKKGLASDSFKRSCFNWGIGRELYSYPMIQIQLNTDEIQETGNAKPKYRASFKLNIKKWKWIKEHDENGNITALACKDEAGKLRFNFGKFKQTS